MTELEKRSDLNAENNQPADKLSDLKTAMLADLSNSKLENSLLTGLRVSLLTLPNSLLTNLYSPASANQPLLTSLYSPASIHQPPLSAHQLAFIV